MKNVIASDQVTALLIIAIISLLGSQSKMSTSDKILRNIGIREAFKKKKTEISDIVHIWV